MAAHAPGSFKRRFQTMQTLQSAFRTFSKLLIPGIGVKRWLGLVLAGAGLLGISAAGLVIAFYRARPAILWEVIVWFSSTPLWLLIGATGGLGGVLVLLAIARINQTILEPFDLVSNDVVDAIVRSRSLKRGPHIVAIGGGTGMPTLLRGLKAYTSNITAIVTVADDGGSSGRLRRDMGVLPPGDFRNNIAALARDEDLLSQLFQYRFGEGGLEGHSFGNLFITAMSGITGSFEDALTETSKVLAVRGRVLPSTLTDVTLTAELRAPHAREVQRIVGESRIPVVEGTIERVALEPENPPAYPGAVRAILTADLIVFGPGSLFTSILPNLLIDTLVEAVRASKATKVYICNVATQPGETDGFTVLDHVRAIEHHTGPGLFDIVIANNAFPPTSSVNYVTHEPPSNGYMPTYRIYETSLVDDQKPWRHSPVRLAQAIMTLGKL
jgi:uncharacterized cofD-like protein